MTEPLNLEEMNLGEVNQVENSGLPVGQIEEPINPDSLANDFLKGIPEVDRNVVAPHVKAWDGQVTQRFQAIRDEYAPYKDLDASPEVMQQALSVFKMAETDPVGFYQYVGELLQDMNLMPDGTQAPETDINEGTGVSSLPEFDGVPDAFVEQFQAQKDQIASLTEFMDNSKASTKQGEDQQQLDNLMKKLHTDHGDFDEDAVMGKMLRGLEPEKAVEEYNTAVQKVIDTRNKPTPPPVLGGGGGLAEQVDPSKLGTKRDRVNAIAKALQSASEG